MTNSEIITKTKDHIKAQFSNESTGHDWWHMYRVWKLATRIADEEPSADKFIVELGALLHDIADWKFNGGDTEAGPKAARKWLEGLGLGDSVIEKIEYIIRNISFKGSQVKQTMNSIEGQIVSDADKLDAIGAIGIARTFAYGGAHGAPIYDPNIKPMQHKTFEEYKNSKSHTVNHFYEKLLLLKDKLYTGTAKDIAVHRNEIMKDYLKEFYDEWEGKL